MKPAPETWPPANIITINAAANGQWRDDERSAPDDGAADGQNKKERPDEFRDVLVPCFIPFVSGFV